MRIRDEHVEELWREVLMPRLREEPVSPVIGTILTEVVRDNLHHGLVDLGLEEMLRWLERNPETFSRVLAERAPAWAPEMLNRRVTRRAHIEAMAWVRDIRDAPDHRARAALDSILAQLAHDLLEDPETQDRAERFKTRTLEHPQVLESAVSLWQALRRALQEALREPEGPVRERLVQEVLAGANRLQNDATLRHRIDSALADAVIFGVSRYGKEITVVISQTIARWDGAEAARRIELHVGRDLQFIRINGTLSAAWSAGDPRVVRGALTGCVIGRHRIGHRRRPKAGTLVDAPRHQRLAAAAGPVLAGLFAVRYRWPPPSAAYFSSSRSRSWPPTCAPSVRPRRRCRRAGLLRGPTAARLMAHYRP